MTQSEDIAGQDDWDDYATCAECGGDLEAVRPGKHQHPGNYQAVCLELRVTRQARDEAAALLTQQQATITELQARLTSSQLQSKEAWAQVAALEARVRQLLFDLSFWEARTDTQTAAFANDLHKRREEWLTALINIEIRRRDAAIVESGES